MDAFCILFTVFILGRFTKGVLRDTQGNPGLASALQSVISAIC